MVSALCVTIACLDFSGAESESAHASQPPPYPAYLAIQAGTTYTLPRGLPGNAGRLTEPPGTAQVTLSLADSAFVISGVGAGFAQWDPGLDGYHTVWIAVMGEHRAIPALVGHHGVPTLAPENTLAGVRAACQLGLPGVEVDVRYTADSIPVLLHDRDIRRTSNGAGNVDEMSLRELQQLDFGSWFAAQYAHEPIPTVDAFLQASANCGFDLVQLDIKSFAPLGADSAFVRLGRAINSAGLSDRVEIGSFDPNIVKYGAALIPGLRTLVFANAMTSGYVDLLIQNHIGAVGIRYDAYLGSPQNVARLDSAGISVGVWAPPGVLDLNALRPAPHFVTTDWPWQVVM